MSLRASLGRVDVLVDDAAYDCRCDDIDDTLESCERAIRVDLLGPLVAARTMARELAPRIRVNAVCPWDVPTPMSNRTSRTSCLLRARPRSNSTSRCARTFRSAGLKIPRKSRPWCTFSALTMRPRLRGRHSSWTEGRLPSPLQVDTANIDRLRRHGVALPGAPKASLQC